LANALDTLQLKTDALIEAQQASGSVVWTYDLEHRRFEWAEGGASIFGRPFDDPSMSDLPVHLAIEEDQPALDEAFQQAFASGAPIQIQFRSRLPGGELRWFETRGTPSLRQKNLWRGVTIDITERKNAEMALVRSEKLAAIGRLSATIAHEMNNPLEAVTNLLFLSSTDPALSPETRSYLSSADQELRRLASIARHTLSFARPRSSRGPAHTATLLEAVVEMFQPRCASQGGEIHIVQNPDLTIAAPADEVRQMLTNLVSNACDAIEGPSGRIAIDVSADDEFATIEVRDNGVGISAENLSHIFEPFFTTKPDVGTGIGLWVTRELVEKCGGEIEVRTEALPPGFRTAFRLQLPLAG
jgi:PAS domain S-box-containing protein